MKKNLLLLTLVFSSLFAGAQNTILWKVSDTINNKTSYIVGTFHQFGNSFVDSIPQIQEAILKSDLAIFESIDDADSTREIIDARDATNAIDKNFNKRDLQKLQAITTNWKVDIYKLQPIELRWKLQQEFQKIICETVKPTDTWDHFDNYLLHIAKAHNISVLGLETDSLQLKLISKENKNPNWKQERKVISELIDLLTLKNPSVDYCALAKKYRKFELDYGFNEPCDESILIKERNENWLAVLPELLKTNNCFIAVGYAHLRNSCGLLEQLKQQGFLVESVMLTSRD
ncbi:TraB/GumN family protein [Bizionia myxarmorum]|uniref:TraB/GumN family protein n=1 Tax=Bizionia myxarmorum TaxID=291186 RepID=A0A5D0RCV0_9FLAO|nr:TraB/GumN family protein [Bizionia myxarmorum]TYB79332.1 TraB/GumN family protein [Bizionia myxarmorum]